MYRTIHDLAREMGQSEVTARRVLREVFPNRGEPITWQLDEAKWAKVLEHLANSKTRRFGGKRRRT